MEPSSKPPAPEASLIDKAKQCIDRLQSLRQDATVAKEHRGSRSKTIPILDSVDGQAIDAIGLLRGWIKEAEKSHRNAQDPSVRSMSEVLDGLAVHIQSARSALESRIRQRRLHLHLKRPEQRASAEAHLQDTIALVKTTIGTLQAAIKNINTATDESNALRAGIQSKRRGQRELLPVFESYLKSLSAEKAEHICIGNMPVLWEKIPPTEGLEGRIGSPEDPIDGVVFDQKEEVRHVEYVLETLYSALRSTVVEKHDIPGVDLLPNTARICLILKNMGEQQHLDRFLARGFHDGKLPFQDEDELIAVLGDGSPYDRNRAVLFMTEQYRAVQRDWRDSVRKTLLPGEPHPFRICKGSTKPLGSGSFAHVYRVENAFEPEQKFALKTVRTHDDKNRALSEAHRREATDHLKWETAQLYQLEGHKHIVKLQGSYIRGEEFAMLETQAQDDLWYLLRRFERNYYNPSRKCKEQEWLRPVLLRSFGCLSRGLDFIHCQYRRHRDIKPSNIVLQYKNSNRPEDVFLWADFGSAHDFSSTPNHSKTSSISATSPRYAPPEVMETLLSHSAGDESEPSSPAMFAPIRQIPTHGRSADIFSLGLVFFETLSTMVGEKHQRDAALKQGFEACEDFYENIPALDAWAAAHIKRLEAAEPDSPYIPVFKIGRQMVQEDPIRRPNINQVIDHLAQRKATYFCPHCRGCMDAEK